MNRILIYEADCREALHLSRHLQNSSFAVATVTTARQAVSFAREYEFEGFIVDLSVPGEMGFSTVAEVKCRPQTTRVGVIGLVSDPASTEAAREAGCDVVLARPLDQNVLLQKVIEILEKSKNLGNAVDVVDSTHSQSTEAGPGRAAVFASLAEALGRNVTWLEAREAELGEQGPIAIESMRDAATNLRARLEPETVSPGLDLPDSVRDHHVRHDFRNLLAVVNGFSEILLLDDSIVGEVRECLQVLKKDSREFCNLLDSIRETEAA